ncbi:internal virion protein [Phage MedPE-SWcel-C56]|uniref:Internal virion protein n=1 Tax=Phage MedPE-SWcel-C56 TaxID=1871314 RepID=A0A1B1IY36_9CAUD|nr:internal virion protein [Phage MedPE-SWcel-C56]ANS06235.1 hypothetical protein [Phage MedPE-SWcel-C56]
MTSSRGLMFAQMGLKTVQAFGALGVAKEEAAMARSLQAFNNTMSAISAAQSNNVTTLNEISAQDAAVRADAEIQRQLIIAEGQAQVAAGAAGVSGGSVDNVMRGLRSSAARAQFARTTSFENSLRAFGQERRNTAVSAAMNKDVSVIPKPSTAAAMLGLGKNVLEIWDSHQTPSETLSARIAAPTNSTVRT